jgi:hypothetical protein
MGPEKFVFFEEVFKRICAIQGEAPEMHLPSEEYWL